MGIPAGTARSARSSSRFVSRIRERQLLSGWLDEVAAGEARIVLMTGPLGVGKSALVRWTVGRARQLGFATLVGSGQEDLDVPYLAVASVLSPPPAVSLDDDAPVVGWGPEADPQARSRLQLFLEASDRLTALARQRPTLVVLDDLHWADPSSLDFVAHLTGLAGAGHVLPVGFVLATRTDVGGERVRRLLARLEREPCVRRMAVAAMNEAELNELLASVAGARPDASVSRAVMESSRGIPFAALEVLRSMMDHADVVVIDGHLVARADMPVLATDAGVDDLLRLRLEKIGDDCRRLLVTAAVIGDDRSMHELARLAREDLSDVLELMEEAEEAGLVEIADDLYRFAHPYLRTRVQASVGTLRLQAIHLSVADALEGDPPPPELALRIAAHLERAAARCPADRLEKAARAALVAASAIGGWSHVVHSANLVLASANDLSSSQRCALHLSAAQAAFRDADVRVAAEHFALVIELATPGEDDDAWLAVNNRAFAWHPEQSGWTRSTLDAKVAEPWFDPDGFLLHEIDGELAAFCWTKVHDDTSPPLGEIFVIAVDPAFHGRGLGRELTLAGLDWLSARGLGTAMLYVEADNVPARTMYEQLGFTIHHAKRWWGLDLPVA